MATSLLDLAKRFSDEQICHDFLERVRWPNGVRCVRCGGDRIAKFQAKGRTRKKRLADGSMVESVGPTRFLYTCLAEDCGHQFTVTANTIFNDSHLSLSKWFHAVALMTNAKKGLSAKQMERDLGVSYRTAWYLCHRVREAMTEGKPAPLTGQIEVDETYLGGAYDKRRKRAPKDKQGVVGIIQRKTDTQCSQVQALPIPSPSGAVLRGIVRDYVSPEAEVVCTDEYPAYEKLRRVYNHQTVGHKKLEYVRKEDRRIHVNGVENFWSLFNRGLVGQFHQVSVKHLERYLHEFMFRFNHRELNEIFLLVIMRLLAGSALPYADLVAAEAPASPPAQPADDEPF